MVFLLCFVLALAIGAVRLYLDKQPRTKARVAQTFLLWLLVVCVGIASVLTFMADAFFADQMAASLGWPAGNPFQSLVAVANLTIGVLGILCYWKRQNFWVATVIAFAVWWPGAAAVHIRDMLVSGNYAPNNTGVTVYMDILVPVILVALLIYYERATRREDERARARGAVQTG
jgi:4-amino-4-deoxy-L-arabinose transferase-like glycosyltransferase